MAFWTNNTGADPKRNFRFKIMIDGLQGEQQGMIWWAKKVTKPNFSVTEGKHSFLNHTYYWPGRVEWQTVTMTLVDPVDIENGEGTVKMLNQCFQDAGYLPLGGPGEDLKTQSRKKFKDNLGYVQIVQIDADGKALETWTLENAFIKKITYGELDYENDDLTQMEVEFRYDYAYCEYGTADGGTIEPNFKPQE